MLLAILVALMLSPAFGQVPEFGPLQEDYFEVGLDPFYPEHWAIMFPALVDLDDDGDYDVFATGRTGGHFVYQENIGAPEAPFSYDHTEDGLQYGFTNESTFQSTECNPAQWLWDFGDGATSEEEHPTHVYAEAGSYNVCLTVTDIAGSDTHGVRIVISGATQQYRQDAIRLYPNPARDFLYLKFKEDVPGNTARVEVFDTWGRLFQKAQLGFSGPPEPVRINLANLPEGMCLVKAAVGEWFYIGEFVKMNR